MSPRLSRTAACLAVAAAAGLAACASGGAAAPGPEGSARAAQRANNRNVLTREDLAAFGSTNLLDAVTALRPRWLENTKVGSLPTQGSTGYGRSAGVAVYVNGQLYGDVRSLSGVDKQIVERMTYLSIAEAQQRYSTGRFQPVIDIQLRRGGS